MEIASAFIVSGLILLVIAAVLPRQSRFCTHCGYVGPSRRRSGIDLAVEALLFLCLIIPGVIYSMRNAKASHRCACCGSDVLVAPDSPLAKQLREEFEL